MAQGAEGFGPRSSSTGRPVIRHRRIRWSERERTANGPSESGRGGRSKARAVIAAGGFPLEVPVDIARRDVMKPDDDAFRNLIGRGMSRSASAAIRSTWGVCCVGACDQGQRPALPDGRGRRPMCPRSGDRGTDGSKGRLRQARKSAPVTGHLAQGGGGGGAGETCRRRSGGGAAMDFVLRRRSAGTDCDGTAATDGSIGRSDRAGTLPATRQSGGRIRERTAKAAR